MLNAFVAATKLLGLLMLLAVGYNMLIFACIASGRHVAYVPWLHFPIKLFVALMTIVAG